MKKLHINERMFVKFITMSNKNFISNNNITKKITNSIEKGIEQIKLN